MKKIIVAIDSFKGCLTSIEANRAAAAGIGSGDPIQIPVSDGGEGWLEKRTAPFASFRKEGRATPCNLDHFHAGL